MHGDDILFRATRMKPPEPSANGNWIHSAVDQYEGPLVRYAARLTGSVETARDVVQETFLRLCKADRAEVEPRLAQWLFTVCRNRAIEVGRKETRMKTLIDDKARESASDERSPTAMIENGETMSRVLVLLDTLPDNQQEVVRLKFQNGLSYREISEVTQLTVTNVGYLLHTAIKTLRGQLTLKE
jgi:RNA polymerase sigma factor (sigma-70 family)